MCRRTRMMKLALLLSPGSKRGFTRSFGRGESSGGGSYHSEGREMARKEHIVKYTNKELEELVKKDGSRSDWEKAAGMTKADKKRLLPPISTKRI